MSGEPRELLHPDLALPLVLDRLPEPEVERRPIGDSLGRALAEDLCALVDQPPFDKSAMDGFAYRAGDEGPYRVIGTLAAGAVGIAAAGADGAPSPASGARPLGRNECIRIMTGAPIPRGADRVQRFEWTEELPPGTDPGREGTGARGMTSGRDAGVFVRFTRREERSNIIGRGENQKAGDLLLSRRFLGPQDIGILASSGYAEVPLARQPRVGVISTGDELARAGTTLAPGSIYDSNGPQLTAQAAAAGCAAHFYGIFRDEPGLLESTVARALGECDLVIVSGGVSMGDFDHVPRAFASAGMETVFHGLAIKPGKPIYFGRRGGTSGFGLPGNPVSTFVGFELFVRPQLERRMGIVRTPRLLRVRLASALKRRECDRVEFLPARLETAADGSMEARALGYRGSSMLSILADADCLLRMEIGETEIEEGRLVDARFLRA